MSDTTSIMDLPTDPAGGGNISINASENIVQNPQQNASLSLDQSTINQIVNGLQQASISGATQLHSRDIPMSTTALNTDAQIQPNYVPEIPKNHVDYINNYEETGDMINDYNRNMIRSNSLDEMYNEIQTPLLLAVLYFLLQLPFFKKHLFNYFPVLFSNDGNLNIYGFLFNSILFGLLFYLLNKTTNNFNTF